MIQKMIYIETFLVCVTFFLVLANLSSGETNDSTKSSNKDSVLQELEKVVLSLRHEH